MRHARNLTAILCAACFVFALGGCKKAAEKIPTQVNELAKSYNCVTDIEYNGIKAQATITKAAPGLCTVTFTQPDILSNLTVSFEGGKIVVNYLGMSLDLSSESVASKTIASVIVNALESVTKDAGVKVRFEPGAIIVNGNSESGQYELALDAQTGFLMNLEFPEKGMKVDFKDFRFVN